MNRYEIKINNAVIFSEGLNEYAALKNLCLFGNVFELLETVKIPDEERPEFSFGWIYKVDTVNGIALAYIKRIRR